MHLQFAMGGHISTTILNLSLDSLETKAIFMDVQLSYLQMSLRGLYTTIRCRSLRISCLKDGFETIGIGQSFVNHPVD